MFISRLIVMHKMGRDNAITKQLCNAEKTVGCDAVLNSKAAEIVKGIDFGDMGIIYFSAELLFLLFSTFSGATGTALPMLILPSCFAFAFTIFSLYYQWKIVKVWCRMCMVVIAVIWLQSVVLGAFWLSKGAVFSGITTTTVLQISLALLTATMWLYFKSLLKSQQEGEKQKIALLKWKRNTDIFLPALLSQHKTDTRIPNNPFQFGSPSAPLHFTIVSNPFCRPCSLAHQQLERLYKSLPDSVAFDVIFLVKSSTDNEDRKLLAVQELVKSGKNANNKLHLLHDWFETTNLKKWQEKYGSVTLSQADSNLIEEYKKWIGTHYIPHTPFIFLNGYSIPKQYSLEDIESMIFELEDIFVNRQLNKEENEKVAYSGWQ